MGGEGGGFCTWAHKGMRAHTIESSNLLLPELPLSAPVILEFCCSKWGVLPSQPGAERQLLFVCLFAYLEAVTLWVV